MQKQMEQFQVLWRQIHDHRRLILLGEFVAWVCLEDGELSDLTLEYVHKVAKVRLDVQRRSV
jgi:hypothetical protein